LKSLVTPPQQSLRPILQELGIDSGQPSQADATVIVPTAKAVSSRTHGKKTTTRRPKRR